MPLKQLPSNGTDRTRVLMDLDDKIRNVAADDSLANVAFEDTVPIREFYAWQHKRNYEGYWFSTTTGAHLRFESLLERQFLLAADHDLTVVSISAQPFAALWPANTRAADGRRLRSHVPDFFCRHSNGDGCLVDVRRTDKTADPHFTLTQSMCDTVGWKYTVFTGLDSPQVESLEWLAGYRMDRYTPASEETTLEITDSFTPGISLRAGALTSARRIQQPREVALGNILHLLFHRRLTYDPHRPLGMDTVIHAGKEVTP